MWMFFCKKRPSMSETMDGEHKRLVQDVCITEFDGEATVVSVMFVVRSHHDFAFVGLYNQELDFVSFAIVFIVHDITEFDIVQHTADDLREVVVRMHVTMLATVLPVIKDFHTRSVREADGENVVLQRERRNDLANVTKNCVFHDDALCW